MQTWRPTQVSKQQKASHEELVRDTEHKYGCLGQDTSPLTWLGDFVLEMQANCSPPRWDRPDSKRLCGPCAAAPAASAAGPWGSSSGCYIWRREENTFCGGIFLSKGREWGRKEMRPLLGKAGQVRAGGAVPWDGGGRPRCPLVLGHLPAVRARGAVTAACESPPGPRCTVRSWHAAPLFLGRETSKKLQEEVLALNRSPGLQTHIPSRPFNRCLRRLLQTPMPRGSDEVPPEPLPCLRALRVSVILGKGPPTPGDCTEEIGRIL